MHLTPAFNQGTLILTQILERFLRTAWPIIFLTVIIYTLLPVTAVSQNNTYTASSDSARFFESFPRPINRNNISALAPVSINSGKDVAYPGLITLKTSGIRKTEVIKVEPGHPQSTFSNKTSGTLISSSVTERGATCENVAGQFSLRNDSQYVFNRTTIVTRDNNLVLTGEVAIFTPPYYYDGLITKMDTEGNIIWSNTYRLDGATRDGYIYYYQAVELADGSIIAYGHTTLNASSQQIILTKIDAQGNTLWHRFFKSRLWTNDQSVRSTTAVGKQLVQDPQSGDVFIAVDFYALGRSITRLNQLTGDIIWARSYQTRDGGSDRSYGLHISNNIITSFGQHYDDNGDQYISIYQINKGDGGVIKRKDFYKTGWATNHEGGRTGSMVLLDNGNFAITKYRSLYANDGSRFPQGFVMEFGQDLSFARAFAFLTDVKPNGDNSSLVLHPDGTGIYTNLENGGPGPTHLYYVQFKNGQIVKQRKKQEDDGGTFDPDPVRLADGSDVVVKMHRLLNLTAGKLSFRKMFVTDTASQCLGVDDNSATISPYEMEFKSPKQYRIENNVIEPIAPLALTEVALSLRKVDECVVTSRCDSIRILVSDTVFCINKTLLVRTQKNPGCGTLLPLDFDTTAVSSFVQTNDSTYNITFGSTWSGFMSVNITGCTALKDSIYIRALEAPLSLSLGKDTMICDGNNFVLNAGSGYATYKWQDGSTNAVLKVNGPGAYHVEAIDACGGIFRDTIIVNGQDGLAVNAGIDQTKCNNDPVLLQAPPGYSNYQWVSSDGSSTFNSRLLNVNPQLDTDYILTVKDANGCSAKDTVRISVRVSQPLELGNDTILCKNQTLQLVAPAGFNSYLWQDGNTTNRIVITESGRYSLSAKAMNGCSSFDSINVRFSDLPVVKLNKKDQICDGELYVLNAGSHASYTWQDGSSASTFQANGIGKYFVTVTDDFGCRGSDTTTITGVLPRPTGFLPNDTALCTYGNLSLNSRTGYSSYLWNNGAKTQNIVINKPGIYSLSVVDKFGCGGSDSVVVVSKECLEGLHIPNAFSPNRDGKNDVFRVLLFGDVERFEIVIYNRWGGRVFQSTDRLKGWDGSLGLKSADVGLYVWICKYQLRGQPEVVQHGQVMLVR